MSVDPGLSSAEHIAKQARSARKDVPIVAAEIAEAITEKVPRLALPGLVDLLENAVHRFIDAFDAVPHRDRDTANKFRAYGRLEGRRGHDLVDFYAALSIITHLAWRRICQLELTPASRGEITELLLNYLDQLVRIVEDGHAQGAKVHEPKRSVPRHSTISRLLMGRASPGDYSRWPDSPTVVVIITDAGAQLDCLADLSPRALMSQHGDTTVIVTETAHRDRIIAATRAARLPRIVVSWDVPPAEIPQAHRWAQRTRDLAAAGVITSAPVMFSRDHASQIWLHAEPELRQRLCQDLLTPLLAESPNSREILSETLLVWLQTRDSAPAIAAELGVHAQTVRYRWKRINELFGDVLHDPEFILQTTMLLTASVPLWKAGDQTDFDRFGARAT